MDNNTKVYELTSLADGLFYTVYCGFRLTLRFTCGFNASGRNKGQLVTSDRFKQDAIEKDERFGKTWRLAKVFEQKEEKKAEPVVETKGTENLNNGESVTQNKGLPLRKKGKKDEKTADKPKSTRTIVETVTNRNDAAEWFAEKGSVFTTDAELQELMEKFDVDFPNLHL